VVYAAPNSVMDAESQPFKDNAIALCDLIWHLLYTRTLVFAHTRTEFRITS